MSKCYYLYIKYLSRFFCQVTIKNEPYVDEIISIQQQQKKKRTVVKPTDLRLKIQQKNKKLKQKLVSTILEPDEIKTEPVDPVFSASSTPSKVDDTPRIKPLIITKKKSECTKSNDLMNFVIKKKSPQSTRIQMYPRLSNSQAETTIKSSKDTSPTKKTAKPFQKTITEGFVKPGPKSSKKIEVDKDKLLDKEENGSRTSPQSTHIQMYPRLSNLQAETTIKSSKDTSPTKKTAKPFQKTITDGFVKPGPKSSKKIEVDEDKLLDEEENGSDTSDLSDEDALLNDAESEGKFSKCLCNYVSFLKPRFLSKPLNTIIF